MVRVVCEHTNNSSSPPSFNQRIPFDKEINIGCGFQWLNRGQEAGEGFAVVWGSTVIFFMKSPTSSEIRESEKKIEKERNAIAAAKIPKVDKDAAYRNIETVEDPVEEAPAEREETLEERRERWLSDWGSAYESDADYEELDRIFAKRTANKPYLDETAEFEMRRVSKWTYEIDKMTMNPTKESIANARSLQAMVDQVMGAEQLRKKDELPEATERLDSLFDAMERSGFMRDRRILPYNELIEVIKADCPRFPHTKDSADQMIMVMRNCTLRNEGYPAEVTLPKDLRLEDVNGEFREKPDKREIETKRALEMQPVLE